ncbi:IPT/TIG domain-containing protein [Streptomyces sp. NPDC002018]|uniref:IPT/TIG domain-containing protein n=1 Tax=Streptomyces sp. NPDC002018 TaxID=3364629 RepID=UPI0036CEF86D
MSAPRLDSDQSPASPQLPFPSGPLLLAVLPPSGPAAGGNTVQLFGLGLSGATGVLFGTTPATIVSQDVLGLTVTVLVPPHAAGTVPVTVTTSGGTSNPASYTYVGVTPPVPPTVTGINPVSGPVAGGSPFVITGTGLTGATVTFNGVPATVLGSTGTAVFGLVPAGAAGSAPVVVTTTSGTATVPGGYTYV